MSLMGDCPHGLGAIAPRAVTASYTVPPDTTCGVAMTISHSDNDQAKLLQAAFDLACNELCISKTDTESRERVASMMRAFAKHGRLDVEKLKAFAVQQF